WILNRSGIVVPRLVPPGRPSPDYETNQTPPDRHIGGRDVGRRYQRARSAASSKCIPSGMAQSPPQRKPHFLKIATIRGSWVGRAPNRFLETLKSIARPHACIDGGLDGSHRTVRATKHPPAGGQS